MKRTIALLAVLGLAGAASAATIGHWDFDGNSWADTSGNGNDMMTYHAGQNPDFVATPGGGTGVYFDRSESDGGDCILTDSTEMIDNYAFNGGWTAEVTFNLSDIAGHQGLLVKTGDPYLDAPNDGHPPMAICKHWDGNVLAGWFFDDLGNRIEMKSSFALEAGTWYSAAMTYDNSEAQLWLSTDGGAYSLVTSVANANGADLEHGDQTKANEWKIGAGMWHGNWDTDYMHGTVNEARVSDVALASGDFIEAIPEPATLGLFGLIGGAMLWVRKRFTI